MYTILPYRIPNIKNKRLLDPHVVILGAGASIAACPTDKNGKKVPALANIHKVLNLTELLEDYSFSDEELSDFELLFSNIYGNPIYSKLQSTLENEVRSYFSSLEIPDELTLYDYLILSLTEKDAIISFNWDPFLMQAYQRNLSVGNLPQVIFPHGNVDIGVCYDCKIMGYAGCRCPKCLKALSDMPLLYPVHKKNYYDGSIIESEWRRAREFLKHAMGLTIFGYGAPETDIEAYNLLIENYKISNAIRIAPFTIINLPAVEKEQKSKWEQIFDQHMISYVNSFKDSILWYSPRVSLEVLFDAILQQRPRSDIQSYRDFSSLAELQEFVRQITDYNMAI